MGSLHRLRLGRAPLHERELLLLHESTGGPNPAGVAQIRVPSTGLAPDKGLTVFMSSRILTKADHLAMRSGIIH